MTFPDPDQIVKMFGPSISDPSKIVNRDVPVRDLAAYSRAGYQKGSIVEVSNEHHAEAQVEKIPVAANPKKRSKK